jgi:hypothetical protein
LVLGQFRQTPPDRARRHAGCHRHRGNATITRSKRLGRRDQTAAALVEKRRHRRKPLPDGVDIDHHNNIWYESQVANTYFYAIKSRCGNFLTDPNRSILTLVPIGLFTPLGWTRFRSRRRNFIRNSVTASSAGSIIRPTSSEFSFRSG